MKKTICAAAVVIVLLALSACENKTDENKATFQATLLEINDTSFLVEPAKGSVERSSADRITVPMKNMDASMEPEVGDTLEIVYDGMIAESYPAQITNVYSIDVVKKGDGTSSFLIPVIHHHYIV